MSNTNKEIERVTNQFRESFSDRDASGLLVTIDIIEKYHSEIDIDKDNIAEAHIIIADYYSRENDLNELLHIIKAIRYRSEDLDLRKKSLSQLSNFLNECNDKLSVNDFKIFEKELTRYSKYCLMKWGKSEDLYYLILSIYERIQTLKDSSSTNLGSFRFFCRKWALVTAKYRPTEQALDYASQIIYEYS